MGGSMGGVTVFHDEHSFDLWALFELQNKEVLARNTSSIFITTIRELPDICS